MNMQSSFSNQACQPRTGRRVFHAYLFVLSIEDTIHVSGLIQVSGPPKSYHTPSLLVVLNIYLFVECFKVIVSAPDLRILELSQGILDDELSST